MRRKFNQMAIKEISPHGIEQMGKIDDMRDEAINFFDNKGFDFDTAYKKAEALAVEFKEIYLTKPPQYNERPNKDKIGIIDFLCIHYRDEGWLDGRFTYKDFSKTNKSGAKALSTWLSHNKDKSLLDEINLPKEPTLKELVRQGAIEKLEAQENLDSEEKLKLQSLRETRSTYQIAS